MDEKVGLGVDEDGAFELVFDEVIVGEATQAGFEAAEDDGDVFECFSGACGIDQERPVGTQVGAAGGTVDIFVAAVAE